MLGDLCVPKAKLDLAASAASKAEAEDSEAQLPATNSENFLCNKDVLRCIIHADLYYIYIHLCTYIIVV